MKAYSVVRFKGLSRDGATETGKCGALQIRLWTPQRSWVRGWLRRDSASVRASRVEVLPDELDVKTLYIVGEGEYLWFAAMLCPGGVR